ncbi:MAG: agmatine deiminase family protein [Bacteroidales bacterium]|nr:agmatine deiminase family protein [Bacteroidales bacterium]
MRRIFTTIALSIVMMSISGFSFAQLIESSEGLKLTHEMTLEEALLIGTKGTDWDETDPPTGDIFSVAEFQPQEGVVVRYPFGIPFFLIKELSEYTKVITIVANSSEQNTVTSQYESNGVNLDNCEFLLAPTNTYWTRDYGPWFVGFGDHQIGIVDIRYNRPRPDDDEIPVELAEHLDLELFGMNLVAPGGNYMSDGLYAAAATDLVYEENADYAYQNPPLSETEVDQMMIEYLGVTNHIVTEDPLGDYIKHIDCWGKFLDVDKILIGQVPESDPRYDDYAAIADYYANLPSSWGNNYNVYRVFAPGGYPATPYTNSLILNNKVFVPQSGSQFDDEAIATYQEAMPGYEIIGVEYGGWENTDALHCRTHELADRGMLLIRHTPIQGDITFQEQVEINAKVTAYSEEAIYADSVRVYYKFDSEDYQFVVMENSSDNNYSATLTVPEGTLQVAYYLHAADESERSENHPYIGAADPHVFTFGAAASSHIEVSEESINTTAMVDLSDEGTFTISNTGTADLTYTISETADWLTLSNDHGTIAIDGSNEITVTTDATDLEVGVYTATIQIASNDPMNPQLNVTVNFDVTINTGINGYDRTAFAIGPNPFNNETNIRFNLNEQSDVAFVIYNINGQKVKTVVNQELSAGEFQYIWNGTNDAGVQLNKGIYFYTFIAGEQTYKGKIVYTK